jgi:hypothetical protein
MNCSKTESIAKTIRAMMMEAVKTITALLVNSFLVGQVTL